MDLITYVECFAVALIGFGIHLLLKFNSLRKKAIVGNAEFSFKSFLYDDWPAFLAGLFFIFLCLLVVDEVLHLSPAIVSKIKIMFSIVGYFNSDLAMRLFSTANKKINETINHKTDIADGKNES
jgi:hypothetical protein